MKSKLNNAIVFMRRNTGKAPTFIFVPPEDYKQIRDIAAYTHQAENEEDYIVFWNVRVYPFEAVSEVYSFVTEKVPTLYPEDNIVKGGYNILKEEFEGWYMFYVSPCFITSEDSDTLGERIMRYTIPFVLHKRNLDKVLKFLEEFKNPFVELHIKNHLKKTVDDYVTIHIRFSSKAKHAHYLYCYLDLVQTSLKETFGDNYTYLSY